MENDTITAISTPLGVSAIGVIRISGKDAINIISRIFRNKNPLDISKIPSHTISYGHILDVGNGNTPIDEVLVNIMRAPRTYTKEDTIEINCHGNPILLQKVLDVVIRAGARLAEPGEFTKRAFLNGRIDLSQAEAVIDLVNAKTESATKLALKHLKGHLSIYIKSIQNTLNKVLISLESNIDFPEDDIPEINYNQIKESLLGISSSIENLIDSYKNGVVLKNGISTAIVGKANVGKSSLFNLLIGSPKRALVTPIPGTTRDLIEEPANIKGTLFRFTDTAGLKSPRGLIEKESLNLTHNFINNAMCVIFLLDGSKTLSNKDLEIWKLVLNKNNIIVTNKIDLPQKISIDNVKKTFNTSNILKISCKENIGVEELKKRLMDVLKGISYNHNDSELILTNIRHKNILENTNKCIKDAINAMENRLSIEFIATDLRHALENLQELSGERVSENILDNIFSNFCIGK